MSAIEVLKKDIISYEEIRKSGKKCLTTNNEECCFVHYPEIKEVLLASEKQEKLIKYLKEEHKNELKQMDEQINVIDSKLNKVQFPEQDMYLSVVLKSLQMQKKNWINKYNEIMGVLK